MYDDKAQVLVVVGGALTGLSSGVFLAAHGVPCVVVERHPDLLIHYILSAAPHQPAHGRAVSPGRIGAHRPCGELCEQRSVRLVLIRAETLADEEYAGIDEDEGNSSDPAASPSAFGAIDQDKLERSYSGTGRGNWCRDVRFLLQS
jgi:hypothetical protein